MKYVYKKNQFLRNKISDKIVKLNHDTNTIDSRIWEVWYPRDGEYCWFCNARDIEIGISPHIGKYGYSSYTLEYYDLCEPWINKLPFGMDKR